MHDFRLTFSLIAAASAVLLSSGGHAEDAGAPTGRFLFAGDDDWDWASPLGAEEPCKLVRYGSMAWSALDWAEEGLGKVQGVIVGTPPDPKKTMTLLELSALRGKNAKYRHAQQKPGVIKGLLAEKSPPNVIILMQNNGKDGALPNASVKALTEYVKSGGRLVVLDDWKRYQPVLDAFVETALNLPPGPAIPENPPAKRPDPKPDKAGNEIPPKPQLPKPKPTPPQQPDPDPKEEKLQKQLNSLIPRLGHEKFKVREEATNAIREMGPSVLKLLVEIESDDPEIAARLAGLREGFKPKAPPTRRPTINPEQRAAQRAAKHHANAELVKTAAARLKKGGSTHRLSEVLVDGDKKILPVLQLTFPAP